MNRAFVYTLIVIAFPVLISLTGGFRQSSSTETRRYFKDGIEQLRSDVTILQQLVGHAGTAQVQQQFRKIRESYKRVELLMEYFYPFFAARLNGPPIPFFEEGEPDKLQQEPEGLQLIESELFPNLSAENIPLIQKQVSDILKYLEELSTIQESFEMNDENIFDAMIEELYRITALGLSGFDSQAAVNSLPECSAALDGIKTIATLHR